MTGSGGSELHAGSRRLADWTKMITLQAALAPTAVRIWSDKQVIVVDAVQPGAAEVGGGCADPSAGRDHGRRRVGSCGGRRAGAQDGRRTGGGSGSGMGERHSRTGWLSASRAA